MGLPSERNADAFFMIYRRACAKATSIWEQEVCMSELKSDKAVQPGTQRKGAPEESESMRRMEKDADKMAEAGQKEEERYDEDHGIFDK
jgi:hypothetical protein